MRSGNPALSSDILRTLPWSGDRPMRLSRMVNKTLLALGLTLAAALFSWSSWFLNGPGSELGMMVGTIGGFLVAMATIFKKTWAPVTTPIYCVLEGVAMGSLSAIAELAYPGIALRAVLLTFSVAVAMLLAYRSGLVKPTRGFTLGVVAATGGIALLYVASLILGLFGVHFAFMQDSSPVGIAFSVFVVAVAALNLVIDFGFIERVADSGAPAYMEWYGAFGLMVTLVWLYVEILHLLMRLQERRD